ncbi:uncharacterized protein [Triticum aestivum]|uniref:uncharacterized protein n=1 Tax=Triticum aestivum TaxID=4565 RepID=UPI001D00A2AC|nr:uncharacterized protein LOC123041452 [Triticum aestivum]
MLPTSPSPSSASLTIGAPHLSPSFHLKPPALPQASGAATTVQRQLPRSFNTGATTGRRPVLWTGEAFSAVDRRVHRWFNFNDVHCWNRLMAVLEPALIFATIGTLGSFLLHPCMAPESARNTGDDDGEGRQPAARGGNRRQGRGRRQARPVMDAGCWSTHERRHKDEAVRSKDAASSGRA